MKKLSILGLVLFLFTCLFAVNSYAATCTESSHENIWDNESFSCINSYLVDCGDNTLMRFQYDTYERTMFAEYYTYDYKFISSHKIKTELPIFGGFYASDDYYFVLTGQTNFNESSSVECFRITKYDKNWKRITSVGLYNCNTTIPFDAGSARFAEYGDFLIIRTAHEMYMTSDGLNHQANVTIELNMKTMKITNSFPYVASEAGYVSHSFNQFIKVDNDDIVTVDHGDAYPRAIRLNKFDTYTSDGKITIDWWNYASANMMSFYGETGNNYTGCRVGAFEISSSAYLVAGSSVVQNAEHFYKGIRNVFISSLSKTTGKVKLTYITDYSDSAAGIPYLVKLSDKSFLLMWEKDSTIFYTKLDASGNVVGKTYKMQASFSDCEPVIINGKIVWYVCDGTMVDFYTINVNKLSETKNISVFTGHNYKVSSSQGTSLSICCVKCGNTKSGKILEDMPLFEVRSMGDGYYASWTMNKYENKIVHTGESIYISANTDIAPDSDFTAYVLTFSDPSAVKIEHTYFGGNPACKITFIKEGEIKLKYSSVYLPEYGDEYTVTSEHSYDSGKVTKKATCSETGIRIYTCTECSATKKTTIAKTAHTYTNACDTTCNVCTAKRTAGHTYDNACDKTCNVCSATRSITHTYKTNTTKATLSKNGSIKTACTKCGKVTSEKAISYPKTFTLSATSYTYNGKIKTPTVTVKDSAGKVLTKDKDYTVTYASGRKNAGTYKVTVKMIGNYTGTKTLTFKINPINISTCKVKLSATSFTYDGKVKAPSVTVTNANGTKLAKNTHYTVTYEKGRKTPGTYNVTIKMKGNYTGTKTLTFKINPPGTTIAALKAGTKSATVNISKKTSQTTGYQIQYATNKNFTNAKTVTIAKNTTLKTTLRNLIPAKTYYVRVRTFKTVNNVKYYSPWSAYKYVKTK